MDNRKCVVEFEPKFGMLIAISLKNYAGILATRILTKRGDNNVDEIKEISEFADTFFNNTLDSLPNKNTLSPDDNKTIDKYISDYILSHISYETVMARISRNL